MIRYDSNNIFESERTGGQKLKLSFFDLPGIALFDFFYRHPDLNVAFSFRQPMINCKLGCIL